MDEAEKWYSIRRVIKNQTTATPKKLLGKRNPQEIVASAKQLYPVGSLTNRERTSVQVTYSTNNLPLIRATHVLEVPLRENGDTQKSLWATTDRVNKDRVGSSKVLAQQMQRLVSGNSAEININAANARNVSRNNTQVTLRLRIAANAC